MKQKGFTLIELLVVISIIGLLSSVVMASLNTARIKARDALRRSEMTQLQLALETYYVDNGSYPLGPALSDFDRIMHQNPVELLVFREVLAEL